MGIDASIPLQTRVFKPKSAVESYGEAMKLKNLAGQQRLQDMQMTQAETAMGDKTKLRDLVKLNNGDIGAALEQFQGVSSDPLAANNQLNTYKSGEIKSKSDNLKFQLDQLGAIDRELAGATPENYASKLDRGIQNGWIKKEDIGVTVPEMFDANFINQTRMKTEQGRYQIEADLAAENLKYERGRDTKADALAATEGAYDKSRDVITDTQSNREFELKEKQFNFEKAKRSRPNAPAGFEFSEDGLVASKGGPWDIDVITKKKTAEVRAKEAALFDPVKLKADAAEMLSILDAVYDPVTDVAHNGLEEMVGAPDILKQPLGIFGVATRGTDGADFMAYYDQITGKQFMEAYKTLKGGGQITEIEGTKATQAMARMSTAQSEEAFISGLKDFREVIIALRDRSLARGGAGTDDGWGIVR